ncbi:MAG: hypothetical protein ACTS5P_01485 [Candidatus Hodgkinia cicadicola]
MRLAGGSLNVNREASLVNHGSSFGNRGKSRPWKPARAAETVRGRGISEASAGWRLWGYGKCGWDLRKSEETV